ncbi:hypothetical protein DsansV1_C26g0196031 [Dioscorea sansibarensis]
MERWSHGLRENAIPISLTVKDKSSLFNIEPELKSFRDPFHNLSLLCFDLLDVQHVFLDVFDCDEMVGIRAIQAWGCALMLPQSLLLPSSMMMEKRRGRLGSKDGTGPLLGLPNSRYVPFYMTLC